MLPALFLFSLTLFAWQRDDLAAISQRAGVLMGAGKFADAIPLYQQLVKAVPGNPGLVLNLALAQHMSGRDREAIPNFETVLKSQPKSLPALVSLGAAHLSLREPKLAVDPLERAVTVDPGNQDARGMLAGALLDLGRFEEAGEHYRSLSELAPDDPRVWYGLGMSYQSLSTRAFEQLQKIDPTSPYVSALVADTRVQRRQYRSAFFFYNEALKKLPNLHSVHAALAEVYRKTGHLDWAAAEDAKERALPPADCKLHPAECQFIGGHDLQAATPAKSAVLALETLYWQAKAANELALQSFFRLGQLPPSVELHQLRAEIARNQNQHLEAAKEWRSALELMPGNPRARQELAISLFMAQDFQGAIAETEDLLRSGPKNPELLFVAGDSWLRLEDAGKAIPFLEAALALDPQLVAAHASLGLALVRAGRNKEAVAHLEKAVELDEDGSLHYQLARAYQATGDAARATTAMAKYQDILKRVQQQKDDVAREAQIGPPR